MKNKIAIIGMSCRFPGASNSVDEFWNNIKAGKYCISEVKKDRWDIDEFYHPNDDVKGKSRTKWGGFIVDFDKFDAHFFGISGREAEQIDPQQRQSLELVWEAFEDAGLKPSDYVKSKTGVFVGGFTLDYKILQFSEPRDIATHAAVGSMMTMLSNRISYIFDLRGPSMSIDTACSSSLVALHEACESLNNNECDLALAGGVELIFTPEYFIAESKAGMLSPTGSCKTFDEKADGYVRGEGGGFLIIKRLEDAERDGDHIYAVITKSLVNQDGKTVGITVPNGEAQKQLLNDVYKNAGVSPADVQYVELHGTGTGVGDPIEANVIADFYGKNRKDNCIISSVKANIGHLEASSGVASVIKSVCSMNEGVIAPHIGMKKMNPKLDLAGKNIEIPLKLTKWPETSKKMVGVNSFGFGGTNAHIIMEEYKNSGKASEYNGKAVHPEYKRALTISAKSEYSLKKLAEKYITVLNENPLDDVIVSARKTRELFELSVTVMGQDKDEIINGLKDFIDGNHNPMVSYKTFRSNGKPVFVYTGMGPQWYAMGLELFENNKVYHDCFVEIDKSFSKYLSWSLIDELHKSEEESNIARTDHSQPMNFALQVALTRMWESMGIKPAAIIGHSVGEVAAFYVAGIYSLDEACRIAFNRSRCQQKLVGKGTMLAAGISFEEAKKYLAGHEDVASVAAINSYRSVTLSGKENVLKEIAAKLEEQGIFNRFLRVNIPYHSVFMNEIKEDLLDSISDISPAKAKIPLYTTANASRAVGEELDANYWWNNVVNPVHFANTMSLLLEDGYNAFLEIGPHKVLSNNINEIAEDSGKNVVSIFSIKRKQPEMSQVYSSYAELLSSCVVPEEDDVYTGEFRKIRLPYYQWEHERYWKESAEHFNRRTGNVDTKLLGYRRNTAVTLWENELNTFKLPFMKDHCISGNALIAGAQYIETAIEVVRSLCDDEKQSVFSIENISFENASFLDENGCIDMSVVEDNENGKICIFTGSKENGIEQTEVFSTMIRRKQLPSKQFFNADENVKTGEYLTHEKCYEFLDKIGFSYGEYFRQVDEAWIKDNSCMIKIRSLDESGIDNMNMVFHPVLLDASFQSMMLINKDSSLMIPVSIKKYIVYGNVEGQLYSYAYITKSEDDKIEGDIYIYNENNVVKAIVEGFVAKTIETEDNHTLRDRDYYKWLYNIEWTPQEIADDEQLLEKKINVNNWIIFDNAEGTGKKIADCAGWEKNAVQVYAKGSFDLADSSKISEIIGGLNNKETYGVLMLSGSDITFDPANNGKNEILSARDELLIPIRRWINELNKNGINFKMWAFTKNAVCRDENETFNILQASLIGMSRVIGQNEAIQAWGGYFDADEYTDDVIRSIADDVNNETREKEIAYRNGTRYVSRLRHLPSIKEGIPVKFDKNKIYVISGGMGSLGKITAEWMQSRSAEEIVLLGRSAMSEKISEELKNITKNNNRLIYKSLDITDKEQVNALFDELRKDGKQIGGVFHTAGVIRDNLMMEMTDEEFNAVYEPKAFGIWNLSEATWNDDLDFFIPYSSIGAVVTSVGQINYAAANSFMDAVVYYRRANGKVAQSVAWGPWATGMVKERNLIKHYKEVRGMDPIYAENGMQALNHVFGKEFAHVIISDSDWPLALTNYPGKPSLFNYLADEEKETDDEQKDFLDTLVFEESPKERVRITMETVTKLISDITYIDEKNLDINQSFNEVGIDSIIATEVRNKIYEVCHAQISITDILKGITISALSDKILEGLAEKIEERKAEYEALLSMIEQENDANGNKE